jgi:hypothetical protein
MENLSAEIVVLGDFDGHEIRHVDCQTLLFNETLVSPPLLCVRSFLCLPSHFHSNVAEIIVPFSERLFYMTWGQQKEWKKHFLKDRYAQLEERKEKRRVLETKKRHATKREIKDETHEKEFHSHLSLILSSCL